MLKVNIILYMNHVIHHIETPPGLTPPRLLAGGWEGKVLYVDSQHYVMNHVIHHIETPPWLNSTTPASRGLGVGRRSGVSPGRVLLLNISYNSCDVISAEYV